MNRDELLNGIKTRMMALYGDRFRGLILYGSAARGEDSEDSDIDLLCLLDGPVNIIKEISPIVDALSELQNSYLERMFDVTAVSYDDYMRGAYPFVHDARKEGVLV